MCFLQHIKVYCIFSLDSLKGSIQEMAECMATDLSKLCHNTELLLYIMA